MSDLSDEITRLARESVRPLPALAWAAIVLSPNHRGTVFLGIFEDCEDAKRWAARDAKDHENIDNLAWETKDGDGAAWWARDLTRNITYYIRQAKVIQKGARMMPEEAT